MKVLPFAFKILFIVVRCKHLDIYFNSHGEKEKQSNQNRSYQQRCYSLARIPFSSNFAMQETYKKALTDRFLLDLIR
jgi:hypothetical protein